LIEVSQMAKQFLMDEELAKKIIDMLDDKPYKEVYEVMEGLLHLKEAPAPSVAVTPEVAK